MKNALIMVDIQNDFCPGGQLEVPEGDKIIPVVNKIQVIFETIVATKDWHPKNHSSFASQHHAAIGEVIDLNGIPQIMWPNHCIQDSWGAEFHAALQTGKIDKVITKGSNPLIDSYSGFFDNARLQKTELDSYLKQHEIGQIYICGLATDYCVKFTALDAKSLGYDVTVIIDACKGVNIHPDDVVKSLDEMTLAGIKLISSRELFLTKK